MSKSLITVGLFFTILACNPSSLNFDMVKLTDLEEKKTSLEQFRGDWVFLNFWASWCGPCVKEMPSMAVMEKHFGGKLKVVTVSDETPEKIKKFKSNKVYPFQYLKLEGRHQDIGIFSIPQSYLLNPKGEIVESFSGDKDWASPENLNLIGSLLK